MNWLTGNWLTGNWLTGHWPIGRIRLMSLRGLLAAALLAALLGANGASLASTDDAARFIDRLGARTVETLSASDLTLAERESRFRGLLSEGLDLDFIGRFALGKYWRLATPGQRADYLALFGEFVLRTYTARLGGGYAGETMTVIGARQANDKDVVVSMAIARPGGPQVVADWRVRATDGCHRIIDVMVEGISMAITHRSEFASVIGREGIDGLLAVLRAHTATAQATASVN